MSSSSVSDEMSVVAGLKAGARDAEAGGLLAAAAGARGAGAFEALESLVFDLSLIRRGGLKAVFLPVVLTGGMMFLGDVVGRVLLVWRKRGSDAFDRTRQHVCANQRALTDAAFRATIILWSNGAGWIVYKFICSLISLGGGRHYIIWLLLAKGPPRS